MTLKQYILILLLVTGSIQIALSQSILQTQIIALEDGLNERKVNNVERDASGFFYFKTQHYIQRWDGKEFVDIDLTSLSSISLLSESKIECLKDNSLILIPNDSKHPMYKVDGQKRTLSPISNQEIDNHSIIHSAGVLYLIENISSHTTKVSQLDSTFLPTPLLTLSDSINISMISVLPNRVIIQSELQEIYSYIYSSKSLIKHDETGHLVTSESQNTILSNDNEIYQFSDERWNLITTIDQDGYRYTFGDYDKRGRILIGHTNSLRHIKTIKIIDNNSNIIPYDFATKPNNRIIDIYADDYLDKAMFATYNGIYYHNIENGEIRRYKQKQRTKKGNYGNIINAITKDTNGNVYFSGENNGLYKYDAKYGEMKAIINGEESNYFRGNLKLEFDSLTHTIWSIGFNSLNISDLYSYNTKTHQFGKYPLTFLANDFRIIDDEYFLITGRNSKKQSDGNYKYIPKIVKYDIKNHTLEENNILRETQHSKPRSIFPYKDYMFITTTTGLIVTDRSMSKILKVINEETTKDDINLKANWIVFVKPYNNKLMVGTNGDGIFMIDPETLELSDKINSEDGLSDNIAVSMEIDPYGNAWITSFFGINIIDTQYQVIRTVYEHDGLSDREFNSNANVTLDNIFYLGTTNGLTVIDPLAYLDIQPSHGLYIDAIEVNYPDKSIKKYSGDINSIKINTEVSSVDINLQFPDYYTNSLEKPMSNTKLSGISEYSINNTTFNIPIKSTGTYKARLINLLNGNSKTLNIDIRKKIPWSTLIVIGSTILLAYLISRFYIKKNKERESEKTEFNKKIAELRLDALKSQMNPHFIFNSLGAIQYFIQTQDTGKADEYLSKFAKLMRLILESSKSDYINIKDEMELMELYADLEYVRFEGLFDYVVDIDDDVDTDLVIPPMIVQPLVENAINHGLYNLKKRKGLLEILTTSPSEDEIQITIRDNGVGRGFQSQSKKPNHKSRGMDILKERISIINSNKDMHIDLQIIDLDLIGKENGTEVIVYIKYYS